MASIRRKPKSKYWHACITLPNGKQTQFSTGIEDEEKALDAAKEAEIAARRHVLKPHQLRAAFLRIAEEVIGHKNAEPAPWLRSWAKARQPEVADGTAKAYTKAMDDAADWIQSEGLLAMDEITPSHVERLRDAMAAATSPGTANGKLKILRMAFKTAIRDKLIATNPAAGISLLKTKETVRREFSPVEIELLLPALAGEWRALFFMGLFTGQRLNDLAELSWRQVNLQNATLAFVARKTGATVSLPLMPQVVDSLTELPSSDDPKSPVFQHLHSIKGPSRSNAFREILASVGLANPIPSYKGKRSTRTSRSRTSSELSFHSLRHTATTMLKAAGVADSIARAIIGHESKAVSRVYTHLDMATMRKALEQMAAVDGEGEEAA